MVTIRGCRDADAEAVGRLIADTYSEFNLSFLPPAARGSYLGPFQHAYSDLPEHRDAIAAVIRAAMVFVAEDAGEIVGVLRGRSDKLQSLFVRQDHHRRGVGRLLVQRFEQACTAQGSTSIVLMATLYAVPFYLAMGYKRTTGIRRMHSFDGAGLPYQPMKKVLRRDAA